MEAWTGRAWLCLRCLRSKRPSLAAVRALLEEDAGAAAAAFPSLELAVVKAAVQRTQDWEAESGEPRQRLLKGLLLEISSPKVAALLADLPPPSPAHVRGHPLALLWVRLS